jgi:hypothetical protein
MLEVALTALCWTAVFVFVGMIVTCGVIIYHLVKDNY